MSFFTRKYTSESKFYKTSTGQFSNSTNSSIPAWAFLAEFPIKSSQLFSSFVIFRQFLHIIFVHDDDKDSGTLGSRKPQTRRLCKQSLNFSRCHKYH